MSVTYSGYTPSRLGGFTEFTSQARWSFPAQFSALTHGSEHLVAMGSVRLHAPWFRHPLGCCPSWRLLGYQPPLFDHQGEEEEVAVRSVQANLRRCERVWKQVRAALLLSSFRVQRQANHRRT